MAALGLKAESVFIVIPSVERLHGDDPDAASLLDFTAGDLVSIYPCAKTCYSVAYMLTGCLASSAPS